MFIVTRPSQCKIFIQSFITIYQHTLDDIIYNERVVKVNSFALGDENEYFILFEHKREQNEYYFHKDLPGAGCTKQLKQELKTRPKF